MGSHRQRSGRAEGEREGERKEERDGGIGVRGG